MNIVCLDLEGVLVPEIWIAFSEESGIPELRRTTRDEPDYDKLMNYRLKILKDRDAWNDRLDRWTEEYMKYADQIWLHKKDITIALFFNIFQRTCQMAVSMFMYIAVNIGRPGMSMSTVFSNGAHLLGAQSLISIGATYIPIPGAMGFTDLMMLDGFSTLMPESEAAALELLSRSISFYGCVIICFIIVVVAFVSQKDSNEEE